MQFLDIVCVSLSSETKAVDTRSIFYLCMNIILDLPPLHFVILNITLALLPAIYFCIHSCLHNSLNKLVLLVYSLRLSFQRVLYI
jgi:hypothetical protein